MYSVESILSKYPSPESVSLMIIPAVNRNNSGTEDFMTTNSMNSTGTDGHIIIVNELEYGIRSRICILSAILITLFQPIRSLLKFSIPGAMTVLYQSLAKLFIS